MRAGKCAKEIEKYCDDIEEGEGKLADCISEQIASSEAPDTGDGELPGCDAGHTRWLLPVLACMCAWLPGRLASCAQQVMAFAVCVADAPEVSDECREEAYQFKISRNSNINRNIPLGEPEPRHGSRAAVHAGCSIHVSVQGKCWEA